MGAPWVSLQRQGRPCVMACPGVFQAAALGGLKSSETSQAWHYINKPGRPPSVAPQPGLILVCSKM